MYTEHPAFHLQQKPDNLIVWRYIDLWKFEDLVNTGELYMASIDKMGDQLEFRVPEKIKQNFVEHVRQKKGDTDAKALENALNLPERSRKEIYLSSWNNQINESFALWNIYTSSKTAVAIKSTVDRLKSAFHIEEEHTQYIGNITYHDGTKYAFEGNIFGPAMYKWNYYEFENEVRIMTMYSANGFEALKTHPEGIRPKVDLDMLIDSIYLAPNATEAEFQHIDRLLKKHGLKKDIYISGIRDKWSNK